jgi:hypothetical protein
MKSHFPILSMLAGTVILLAVACSKGNEAELSQGNGQACDTVNMKYSANVVPILESTCYSCHSKGNTDGSGGISLDSYADLKQYVTSGQLAGNIVHAPGFIGMPYGQPKMDNCDINIILAWINRGAPNN